ncbi:MAG: putative bifunctional diguanylate cyclase/phosphodiesterase [Actinomycetes bacterium]
MTPRGHPSVPRTSANSASSSLLPETSGFGRWIPTVAGLACVVLGAAVIAARAVRSPIVDAATGDDTPMQPWSAVALILLGLSVLGARRITHLSRAVAAAAALLAAVLLVERVVGAGSGFDLLILPDATRDLQPSPDAPGRPSLLVAACLLLLGVALAALSRSARVASALATVVVALAYMALIGHLYGETDVLGGAGFTPVALPTAVSLVLVGVATAALAPEVSPARLLAGPGPGGMIMRRALPVALLAAPAVGLLLRLGDWGGLWHVTAYPAALTLASAVTVSGVGIWVAHRATAVDEDRIVADDAREALTLRLHTRTAELETLLGIAPVGISETDPAGKFRWVNDTWTQLTGWSAESALGDGWQDALHPDDRDRVRAEWQDAVTHAAPFASTYRYAAPDGRVTVVQSAAHPVFEGSRHDPGAVTAFLATVTDVTAASRAEARFRAAFEDAPVGMALVGDDDRLTQANRAMAEMLEVDRDALVGLELPRLVHSDDLALLAERLVLTDDDPSTAPRRDLRWSLGDQTVWTSVHAVRLDQADGFPARYLLHVVDVTERHEHEQRLAHLADHDPLTGLLNRRSFEQRLSEALDRIERYGGWGALLLFDLDGFKNVNDTLGHSSGDQVLVSTAEELRRHLRTSDLIGRLGGDEFAVYLPLADRAEATLVAEKVLSEIRTRVFVPDVRGTPHRITASMGVALSSPDGVEPGDLFRRADAAMYVAKDAGKDQFVIGAVAGEAAEKTRASWGHRIETALAEDRLVLHAQPIVDLRTGATTRHEVLVRLVDEDGSLVPAAAFIQEAERLGSAEAVDIWVTQQAIDLAAAMPGGDVLEINLSGRSLGTHAIVDAIAGRLKVTGVDPRRLVFEVTETEAIAHLGEVRECADDLHALGCRFALDDFGTGFGSFAYLKHLPVDFLKIDPEFVRECATNRTARLVVEAVVAVAHGLGKETIAEHVADDATLEQVRKLGVDYAQGFGVGRPVPVQELVATA